MFESSLYVPRSGLLATMVSQCASWRDKTALVILPIHSNLRVNHHSAYSIASECQLMTYQARMHYSKAVLLFSNSMALGSIKAASEQPN